MRPRRRPLDLALGLGLLAVSGACLEHTVSYGPQQDDAAMALIASTFEEGGAGGLVLSLCEDRAAAAGWTPNCREQHVVQGGGAGLSHRESNGGLGCGGCPFETVAWVQGTVSGGPFPAPVPVRGEVRLGWGSDGDPYALPWSLALRCEGEVSCQVGGTLEPSEVLQAQLTAGAGGTPEPRTLRRGAAAACQ